jgi:DNA-binding CsgD family transcriptional regulator/tetratricopeptide (TPR) repeat protein
MATQLHRETDGNPLFLSKLIRDLGEHGELFGMSLRASMSEVVGPEHLPKTIQDSFSQRFEERTADCRQALLAAAVIGRPFDLSLLGQVSGLEGLSLLEAADEAEMARLIQPIEEPGRYRFKHALVRRAIYQEVPRGRLAKLHWRAAEELRKRYGAEVAHVEEIAHHHVEGAVAGDPVEAARWAKAAGDRARALFAFEDATRWYQSALEICELQLDTLAPERVALLLTLGRTYVAAGHLKVASRVLYQAAAAAREAGDVIALAKIALSYPPEGRQFQRFDPTYLALLTEVLSGLPEDQRVLRACVLAKMAIVRVADATQTALQLSEQATELARHVGDATALSAALTARRLAVAGVPGEPDPSTDDELLTVAESTGEPLSIIETRRVRVLERLERADIWGAETEMQAYKSVAARLHQPYHAWQLAIWHAMRTTVSGDFVASDRLISEAYHLGRSLDPDHAFDTFTRQRFSLALLRGTSGEMISELEELTARTLDDQEGVLWRFYLARAYYESGLTDDASRELRTIVTSDFSAGLPPRQFLAKLTLIAPLVASLADERAQRRTLDLLHLFEDKAVVIDDGVAWQGAVSHYIALMERAQGRWTAAYEHLNRALAMYRQANAAPWQAIACLEVARVSTKLGGSSQVANALELASEAKRTAVALKMDRLSAEAGEFLGAGKPDGVQVRSVPFGLSEREVEVLRLLATGHSSREIAGELVISTRTAEHHVQNIYNKTGARRRVDAATLASRLGLGPV